MDDNTSELAELKIERERDRVFGRRGDGDLMQKIGRGHDPRLSGAIRWVWATLGSFAILIGVGMYKKLSDMSDTLISVAAKLENQGNQVADLKADVRDLRAAQGQLQRQVDSLEGKTLRGIEEMKRGN